MSSWRFKNIHEVIQDRITEVKNNVNLYRNIKKYCWFVIYSITTIFLLKFSQVVLDWNF